MCLNTHERKRLDKRNFRTKLEQLSSEAELRFTQHMVKALCLYDQLALREGLNMSFP